MSMWYLTLFLVVPAVAAAQPLPVAPTMEPIPPLIEAVWNRDIDRVKWLLSEGADPDGVGVTKDGMPPWYWAIANGEYRAAELMLAKAKNVERPAVEGVMPRRYGLLMAVNANQIGLVRMLIEKGLPVDSRARDKTTALMIAAASGYVDTLKLLIERGAGVSLQDDHGDTALMAAVRSGSLGCVKALLAAGAEVNHKDNAGRTALWWAVRSERQEVANAVKAAGASLSDMKAIQTGKAKGTPREAVERSLPLIQRGAADWKSRAGCLSCHHAPMMLRATALAKRLGFAIDKEMLEAQIPREQTSKGTLPFRSMNAAQQISFNLRRGDGDLAFFGWILSSFVDAGMERDADKDTVAMFLANLQIPDGSWRYGPARVPLVSSQIASTASAIRALRYFGRSGDAELSSRIQRGTEWIRAATPVTTDDMAYHLFGLHWTASEPALIRKAADLLLKQQNADGGWPQLQGLNSDAYETGQVLVALHEAGGLRVTDPAYRRGVQYLLKMQEPDGSWLVPSRTVPGNKYFESGSPHGKFQFISYAGTCWATMALMYASVM